MAIIDDLCTTRAYDKKYRELMEQATIGQLKLVIQIMQLNPKGNADRLEACRAFLQEVENATPKPNEKESFVMPQTTAGSGMQGRIENDNRIFAKAEEKLLTMPDYTTDWYNHMRASYMTAATCRDYIYKVALFLASIKPVIKDVKTADITEGVVTKYMIGINTRIKNGKIVATSDSYKNTVWFALNSFLQFLAERGLIEKNYIQGIKRKKNKDLDRINKHRIKLTIDDFNKILKATEAKGNSYPERDRAILLLFMTTGMRKMALSSINLEDINFDKRCLVLIDKGDVRHEYALNDNEINALIRWIKRREKFQGADKTSALFISNRGNRISEAQLETIVNVYSKKALGKEISPHKLRSGFVTIMYEKTKDIEKVRRMVGHANLETTQRYIVTDNKEKEEAADIMQSLLS